MAVTDIRTKIAVVATVFGLGGLAGFAMNSNPANTSQGGAQAPLASTQVAGAENAVRAAATPAAPSPQPISTHTSGAATAPGGSSTQPVSTQLGGGGAGAKRGGLNVRRAAPPGEYD